MRKARPSLAGIAFAALATLAPSTARAASEVNGEALVLDDVRTIASGAAADGWDTTKGTKADAPATSASAAASEVALFKGLLAAFGFPTDGAAASPSSTSSAVGLLKGILAAEQAALPAGANVIGSTTLRATGTNRSASISTTASTPMATNGARTLWKLKNDCTVDVWINFYGTASAAAGSGNMRVPAGAYLSSEPAAVETGALSAITASGTCPLTLQEF